MITRVSLLVSLGCGDLIATPNQNLKQGPHGLGECGNSCNEPRVSVCDHEALDMMLTLDYESHTISEQLRDRLESLQIRRVWNLLCARSVNVICVAADVSH